MPMELEAANMVDKFGAQAVYGRILGVSEMRRMNLAQKIHQAYYARKNYKDAEGVNNWAEFAEKYPAMNDQLNNAMTEAEDYD